MKESLPNKVDIANTEEVKLAEEKHTRVYPDVFPFIHDGQLNPLSWKHTLNNAPVFIGFSEELVRSSLDYLGGINKQLQDSELAVTLDFLEMEFDKFKTFSQMSNDKSVELHNTSYEDITLGQDDRVDRLKSINTHVDKLWENKKFKDQIEDSLKQNIRAVFFKLRDIKSSSDIKKIKRIDN